VPKGINRAPNGPEALVRMHQAGELLGSLHSTLGRARDRTSGPLDNPGLPAFTIVGLTDRAIQEARERVKPAIRNAGFKFPQRRVTVSLAPAELPKEGTSSDLALR
jgi:hypothetical protein